MVDQASVDRVFAALGDGTRRALLEQLTPGPMSVTRLAEPFDLTLAAVVQHLQVLERAGLVTTEKIGRVRTCRLEPLGLQVATDWLSNRRSPMERRLDRLGALLVEEATRGAGVKKPNGTTHSKGDRT
jgi:DNA-binding transcriptional ArsR family regulator